ncbi:DUF4012 domain-containing protein [Arthrobacter sp. NPDC057009]|uniref:DUF4012 domain-containing protein n=1 Tax=Arthrobacter sp. NPDC057009 TaxID=3345996 RepID=UPI0036355523
MTEVALSVDDVVNTAAEPLLHVALSDGWAAFAPVDGRFDLKHLEEMSPRVVTASNTVDLTYARLKSIDQSLLLAQVRQPLTEATAALGEVRGGLRVVADTSRILPDMMGNDGPRNFLVLVQNNAEVRATGGLPGALAVLRVEDGKIALVAQSSGSAMGKFNPSVPVDKEQTRIYTERLGTYISDVNLTPDFPTAARSAKTMWEQRHHDVIDGVIALDPVVLSHILEAGGPIAITAGADGQGLPATLTKDNVVATLLSDVYTNLPSNDLQDTYFAAVSQKVFEKVASGNIPVENLLTSFKKSIEENRLYIWSARKEEQDVLGSTDVGGSVAGRNSGGASYGVYFNDGTGAKMDYFVHRKIELVQACQLEGGATGKVRVTLKNTVAANAASSLPWSVTGGGAYGTPPGKIATNVVVYGPSQAQIEGAFMNGIKTPVGSFIHAQRPVGVVRTLLAPGQSTTVEFDFSKIVQDEEPTLRVTPTTQDPVGLISIVESDEHCNEK